MRGHRLSLLVSLAAVLLTASANAAPDFSGIWLATSPRSANRENIPELTPRAEADRDAFDPLDDPVIRCVIPGFPRSGLIIYPFEIVQSDDTVYFLYEHFGMVRRIYMDRTRAPEYYPPGRMGFSVGRWDGDELVIETTHVAPGLLLGDGLRQYGDASVVERYRLTDDGQTLQAALTVTAPETFRAPWTRNFSWERDPDGLIFEAVCDPDDRRF